MKVVLVNPPLNNYSHILNEPLGLLYLAAAARDKHEIMIIDAYGFSMMPQEIADLLVSLEPDAVGVGILFSNAYNTGTEILERFRRILPDAVTFVGGNTASFQKDSLCRMPAVDYVMLGESDLSFPIFLDALEQGGSMEKVPGLAFCTLDGQLIETPRVPEADLDALRFPARDLLPLNENYLRSFLSSRGCSYGCIYCSASAYWGRRVRYRSKENLLAEIESQRESIKNRFFSIIDDCFTINSERALSIARGIKNLGMEAAWGCNGRLEQMTPEFIKNLYDCGCHSLFFGVESGCTSTLQRLGRRYTPETVLDVYHCCCDLGIDSSFSFIVGLPGEGPDELAQTFKLIDRLKGTDIGIHILTPLPGTAIALHPEEFGITLLDAKPETLDLTKVHLHTDTLNEEEIRDAYRKGVGRILRAVKRPREVGCR